MIKENQLQRFRAIGVYDMREEQGDLPKINIELQTQEQDMPVNNSDMTQSVKAMQSE